MLLGELASMLGYRMVGLRALPGALIPGDLALGGGSPVYATDTYDNCS